MREANAILDTLERLEKLINVDRETTAQALGLLLLGRKPNRDRTQKEYADPVDLLLKGHGPEMPEF